jgi:hypothetical protein
MRVGTDDPYGSQRRRRFGRTFRRYREVRPRAVARLFFGRPASLRSPAFCPDRRGNRSAPLVSRPATLRLPSFSPETRGKPISPSFAGVLPAGDSSPPFFQPAEKRKTFSPSSGP